MIENLFCGKIVLFSAALDFLSHRTSWERQKESCMHACCVFVCVSVCLLLRNHLLYYLLASSYSSIFPPIPPPPLPISPPVLFLKLPACLSSCVLRDLTLLLLHLTRKSKLAFLSAYPVRFRKLAGPFRTGPGCCTVGQCCKKLRQNQDDRCRWKFSCARLKRSTNIKIILMRCLN